MKDWKLLTACALLSAFVSWATCIGMTHQLFEFAYANASAFHPIDGKLNQIFSELDSVKEELRGQAK